MAGLLRSIDWHPFVISIEMAIVTAFLLLLLATPVAYILAFGSFRGKSLLNAVFALPLVLPPTVLGFFVLVAIGNLSPVGQWYKSVFGSSLAFSFEGLIIASILYSFPFAVQPIQNSFESINKGLLDTARTLGCSKWTCFLRVVLPASRTGLVTGIILSFAHTIGEFGAVLMVGGSIPGETRVASIAIYEHAESLEYSEAAVMALVLLIFSFAVMSLAYHINKRAGRLTPR